MDVRRQQLESHYGKPLAVLATVEGDRDEERRLHEQFAHLRFGRTEQFRPGPDLMSFIGRPLLVDANPDAVEAISPTRRGRAIKHARIELPEDDYDRLKAAADRYHLSVAGYIRMAVIERIKRDEVK